jgi:hypothetical protein
MNNKKIENGGFAFAWELFKILTKELEPIEKEVCSDYTLEIYKPEHVSIQRIIYLYDFSLKDGMEDVFMIEYQNKIYVTIGNVFKVNEQ